MTLFNKKAKNQNDRISYLPINVIDGILANLRVQDQVRTSILSTKWRYMWTSAPHLCFDKDFFKSLMHVDDPYPEISKIIRDVLMLHNGPIHKFTLIIPYDRSYKGFKIIVENLNMWIPFMSKDIKHLELFIYCTRQHEYQMPDIIFSCKELTYFKISSFKLSIPPNFCGFKKMVELHLYSIKFDSSTFESFMSACPFLEKLSIECCTGCDYLVISSPSLKVLMLKVMNTKSVCLKKANNLIDFKLISFHREVSGLIKSLPKIKKFSLATCTKNPYADIIPPTLLMSSFSSLEYLKLDDLNLNDKGDILYCVSVLKSAPRLIELVIKQSFKDVDTTQVSNHSKDLECRNCCLKLQTVDIRVSAANSLHGMSLIRFILANSPLLETLTFNYWGPKELDAFLKISKDFLWMKRASPKAQVNFLHPYHTSLYTL